MAAYLTQEWLDLHRGLADAHPLEAGTSIRLQHVVSGAPEGDVRYGWVVEDGRLVDVSLGDLADPDTTVTSTYPAAVAVLKGDLQLDVAFMQGTAKVAGNMAKMLVFLRHEGTPDRLAAQAELATQTTFD